MLARFAMKKNQNQTFLKIIEEVQKFSDTTFQRPHLYAFVVLGEYYHEKKKYTKALEYFQKALAQAKVDNQAFPFHHTIGKRLKEIAKCYLDAQQADKSLATYQEALAHFTDNFTPSTSSANPELSQLHTSPEILILLEGKAQALLQLYQQKQDPALQDRAIETYLLAIDFIRQLRQEYLAWESKTILAERVIPIFEGAMEALYQKHEESPSVTLMQQIFQLAESSKAALLLESIQENNALGFAGIPAELVNRERELKSTISFHQKEILKNRGAKPNEEKVKRLEEALFTLRREHQELIDQIEKDYPRYHQIKYDNQVASIEQVRTNLGDDKSALLEYFVGEKNNYLIYISSKNTTVRQVPRSANLSEQTDQLRQLLHRPPTASEPTKAHQQFVQTTHNLYQELLGSITLPEEIERLLIIPDDLIGYIPFEVLLPQPPQEELLSYAPNHLDYLINHYQISYTYSATLWLQSMSHQRQGMATKPFLGMAPSFGNPAIAQANRFRACDSDNLSALLCNEQEVEQLESMMGGKAWLGKSATKAKFLKYSKDYRILHLATHSCLDDENPLNNKIFLADDHLSHFDLSNLELNADLAVLSACNTGNGPLQKGEGVMSLSRGFILAGCPSTLISLWSVEDCTTAEIMKEYYAQLRTGATKDQAIYQAKRQFLQDASRLQSHPFYWAPFVQFGDRSALSL